MGGTDEADARVRHEAENPSSSPLDEIVDDEAEREAAMQWARAELCAGKAAEDVAAEMIAQGWDAEIANEIAQAARVETRRQRGVITRGEVVAAERRRARFSWAAGYPALASLFRLLESVHFLRNKRRDAPEDLKE